MPSSFIILAAGPLIALPPIIGETATLGPLTESNDFFKVGTLKIGSILTNGLDGAIRTEESALFLFQLDMKGIACSKASNLNPVTAGLHCSRTK